MILLRSKAEVIFRRFSDLRKLPSLVPSHIRNATAQAVGPELDHRIKKLRSMIDSGSVETDLDSNGMYRLSISRCFSG